MWVQAQGNSFDFGLQHSDPPPIGDFYAAEGTRRGKRLDMRINNQVFTRHVSCH